MSELELELDEPPSEVVLPENAAIDVDPIPIIEKTVSQGAAGSPIFGMRIGVLVGLRHDTHTPLVIFPGQPDSAAVPARATVDLCGTHVGHEVVLAFDDGNPYSPIIIGRLKQEEGWLLPDLPGQVQIDADGERLLVTAKERLVLRCGKASVTLTKAGKILIEGTYFSSHSSGVTKLKGGSVQIN